MSTPDEQVAENLKALLEAVQYRIYVEHVKPSADWDSKHEAQVHMEQAFVKFMPDSDIAKMLGRFSP